MGQKIQNARCVITLFSNPFFPLLWDDTAIFHKKTGQQIGQVSVEMVKGTLAIQKKL